MANYRISVTCDAEVKTRKEADELLDKMVVSKELDLLVSDVEWIGNGNEPE